MRLGKDNSLYKELKEKFKKDNSYILVDDLNSLEILLSYNLEIEDFIYIYDTEYHDSTKDIILKACNKANNVYEISKKMFEPFSSKENSIGFIAFVKPIVYNLNDLKNKDFLIVLDRLEIPGNIGTILRTMDSVKASALILVDPISKILNKKMCQLSRGTNLIIPSVSDTYSSVLNFLLENNYDIFLGEPNLGKDYQEYDYNGKIAIVIGNERFGINPDWYNHKHKKVFIPMEGHNNSLNVSVAASILMYEAYMKRKK